MAGMSKEEMARVDIGEEAIHQIMQDFTGHSKCEFYPNCDGSLLVSFKQGINVALN